MVGATKTEANQALSSLLTISTQRQDPRTSNETELKANSVLAKFVSKRDGEDAHNLLLLLSSSQEQERTHNSLKIWRLGFL